MPEITLKHALDVDGWREAARRLFVAGTPPEHVAWSVGPEQPGLFDDAPPVTATGPCELRVPLRFILLVREVAAHADPGRWALLYRLLWRIGRGETRLLDLATDADVARAQGMAKAVQREIHKLKAFVRFKEVWTGQGPHYLAWFEPEHRVLQLACPHFTQRFANLRWSILTPERSAHWDGSTLLFGPGGRRADVPAEDALDDAWAAYYASIFNPARLNPAAMQREMPKRYWKNLPEARLIPALTQGAAARQARMIEDGPAEPSRRGRVVLLPHRQHEERAAPEPAASLPAARTAASHCRACGLWESATQTVFGEGPASARVMLVGEQPGDQEDLSGRPFVGPAGRLLDSALVAAGLDRRELYLTNAVKHFKFTPRGKRRLHQTADAGEVKACRWWLEEERKLVQPSLVVALGVTAATALLERPVTLRTERGRITRLPDGTVLLVTTHPAAILRQPEAFQPAEFARLVAELRLVRPSLEQRAA